ncbi:MAG: SDR family NAD(P)-dependent oxidoreductase [Trueperaceae bacterium]
MTDDENRTRDDAKVALVTGAGGGAAPAVVAALRERGWRVALLDRPGKEARLRERYDVRDGDERVAAFGADLADDEGASAAVKHVLARFGAVDAVLNLAGGFATGKAHEAGLDALERMLTVNLRTAVATTRAVLPSMLERGRGAVVGIAAAAASNPAPGMAHYAASKAAVAAYFRSVAAEVADGGIDVVVLFPMSAIDTPANREGMPNADTSEWIAPEALAEAVLFLLERPARGKVRELELRGG